MGHKETLGEFEHHVMLAILRLGADAYTASIVLELERTTGREVSAAAVYIAIRRLEESGFVRTKLRKDARSGERRERRLVTVTPSGMTRVREARHRLLRLWQGLDDLLPERA
jgi:PadR family transcriptional regulator PadR